MSAAADALTERTDALFASAAPAARAYRDALPPGTLLAFPLTPLDRTGIPTMKTVFFGADGVVHNGHSYGPTQAQALLGAMGELAEGVQAHAALRALPRRRATYAALAAELGVRGVVHPWTLCVPAGSPVDGDTELDWVEARRFPGGEPVLVPLDVAMVCAGDAPGYAPYTTPITNGLGAGPTLAFAVAHGVQEILQRDGNGLRFRALDAGVALDLASVADPVVRDLLVRFERAGIEPIVKLADDEFGVANVYVVGGERPGVEAPFPLMVTCAGEAASPSRDTALRKALLEFGAARPRKTFAHGPLADAERVAPPDYVAHVRERVSIGGGESRTLEAMLRWLALDQAALRAEIADPILRVRETRDAATLPDWAPSDPDAPPGQELAALLAERLGAAGLEILAIDCTTPESAAHGVHAVRAIVPGLEVETPSYHRIGERNARKLLDAASPLVAREPGPGRERVRLLPEAEARLGGAVWLDVAAVDRLVEPFYALYREPDVHEVALALEARAR